MTSAPPAALQTKLESLLSQAAKRGPAAVFDADGTLWREDVNDLLFRFQSENRLRNLQDLQDPRFEREDLRPWFCRAFAERQKGLSVRQIRSHVDGALEKRPLSVFSFQKKLMIFLRNKGVRVFVVTASLQYAVERALEKAGFPADQVLGVRTEARNQVLTDRIIPPLTYGKGKKEAFRKAAPESFLVFASGNTLSDVPLMKAAGTALAVHSASKEHKKTFSSEQKTRRTAQKQGWFILDHSRSTPQFTAPFPPQGRI